MDMFEDKLENKLIKISNIEERGRFMCIEYVCSSCGFRTDDEDDLEWANETDYYCPLCG